LYEKEVSGTTLMTRDPGMREKTLNAIFHQSKIKQGKTHTQHPHVRYTTLQFLVIKINLMWGKETQAM
jgi:hypothetical protein